MQALPLVLRVPRWLPSLAFLLPAGCLVAAPSCPNRPADPEIWFGEAWLEPDAQLRLGAYLVGPSELRPILEWAADGAEAPLRRTFEPFGRAGHGAFVAALEQEVGVVLLAAHEGKETLGLVVLGPDGEVRQAREVQLAASPLHFSPSVAQDAQGFVVGLALKEQGAGLLWFDPQARLVRSLILPGIGGVTDVVLHRDRSLSVLGHGVMSGSGRIADGLVRLSAEGEHLWQRNVEFLELVPGRLSDPSLAVGPEGATLMLGGRSAQYSTELVLAELDSHGGLVGQRRFPRPWPQEPLDWTPGPITQRAVMAEDGTRYVAATVPFEQQGSSYLTLLELAPDYTLRRQSATETGAWQLYEVRVVGGRVRVRGKWFFECAFELASLAGCAPSIALPALVSLPVRSEIEVVDQGVRPGPMESWPVELVPWTPPD